MGGLPSQFIISFKAELIKHYNDDRHIRDIAYFWCRERGKENNNVHYHFTIMLDGKVAHPSSIFKLARKIWAMQNPQGTIYRPKNCFYDIKSSDDDYTKYAAVYRLSYLAKVNTKKTDYHYLNRFGTSQLSTQIKKLEKKAA